jgi:hypothetical protein
VTAHGQAVGLFANNNHSGLLAAVTVLTIAHVIIDERYGVRRPPQRFLLISLLIFAFFTGLTSGSRAGLLASVFALLVSVALMWAKFAARQRGVQAQRRRVAVVAAIFLLGVLAISSLFLLQDRLSALNALSAAGVFEDLRWQILPILRRMVDDFWLFGAGFGGFEQVYRIYEPAALMTPRYVNHAHMDVIELVIEGGVPAVLLLGIGAAWFVHAVVGLARNGSEGLLSAIYWASVVVVITFGSLVDYPLRTPLFAAVAALLAALLAFEFSEDRERGVVGPVQA